MKNIQLIDGADNAAYDIYAIPDEDFDLMFPNGQDIEFVEDFFKRLGSKRADEIYRACWTRRVVKPEVQGIHGTLFVGLKKQKEKHYPTKRFSDDGASAL